MDLNQIEELMEAMGRNGMKRVSLKEKGIELELEKECSALPAAAPVAHQAPPSPTMHHPRPPEPTPDGRFVTSPMVGTFYASPSPEDPPFAKVGDSVTPNTVVCIIEAMKVMNEVKAGESGTIKEVLVKNGDPVEFGTKIFRIV